MKVILAFEDPELAGFEKQIIMLRLLYKEMPEDSREAASQAMKFLNGGKYGEEKEEMPLRLYSFERDAELIYSAFRQTHGIDLSATEPLHWWKFLALFMDLGADTAFCNLVNLRKRVKTNQASKEEREAANSMGSAFELPEYKDEESLEKEQEFFRLARVGAQ